MRVRSLCATTGLLVLVAMASWSSRAAAQAVVGQVQLTNGAGGNGPSGAGYAQDHVYFCGSGSAGGVWKVATGNANGPSDSTDPSEVNALPLSAACQDGTVGANTVGYWLLATNPFTIAKTNGNAGSAPMTLVGEYQFAEGAGQFPQTLALDEVANVLYVGTGTKIFKLDAGSPSSGPTYLSELTLDAADGSGIFGLAVDPATGYGYAGTNTAPKSIVKFSLGGSTGTMTRIDRVGISQSTGALTYNNGAVYIGYQASPPDMEMFLAGSGNAAPTSVGDFNFGQGSSICINKAFVVSGECNYLFAGTCSDPGYLNYFDLGDGQAVPTFEGAIALPEPYLLAGTYDQYGYQYYTTGNPTPPIVFKISPPDCKVRAGGPFTITGSKMHAKKAARAGSTFKVTFALTRWAAGYADVAAAKTKTKTWENFDVLITLPDQGATLRGKPRVSPRIRKRKAADVADNTMIAWNAVPMLVQTHAHKNYTRKFSFAVKVDKTFVGDLTFAAAATGPQDGWLRDTTLTVPVTASTLK